VLGRFLAFLYGGRRLHRVPRHHPLRHRFRVEPGGGEDSRDGTAGPIAEALIVNLVLMSIFALQHSVMARKPFQAMWTQYVPKAIERRPTCCWELALVLLFWQWRPMPAVVWQIADPQIAMALTGLSLFAGDRVHQHVPDQTNFELYRTASGRQRSRRPHHAGTGVSARRSITTSCAIRSYLGFIIAFWAAPT